MADAIAPGIRAGQTDRDNNGIRTRQRLPQWGGSHEFQSELDAVRRELAAGYLADPNMSAYEIATRLGYAEPRPFERAFRGRATSVQQSGGATSTRRFGP